MATQIDANGNITTSEMSTGGYSVSAKMDGRLTKSPMPIKLGKEKPYYFCYGAALRLKLITDDVKEGKNSIFFHMERNIGYGKDAIFNEIIQRDPETGKARKTIRNPDGTIASEDQLKNHINAMIRNGRLSGSIVEEETWLNQSFGPQNASNMSKLEMLEAELATEKEKNAKLSAGKK